MTTNQCNPDASMHAAKAQSLWDGMDDNEKTVVRFSMFPHEKMMASEQEDYNGQQLAVALMACAKSDGGMRA